MFKLETVLQTFEINLRFIYNIDYEIKSQLNKRLLKFSEKFGGFMMAYRNIENLSLNKSLKIYTSTPCVYVKVKYEALIFSPTKGCEVHGEVSVKSESRIYVQVFGYIQGVVKRVSDDEGDEDEEVEGEGEGEEKKLEFSAGDVVTFKFDEFFMADGAVKIRGHMFKNSKVFHRDQSENFSVLSFQSTSPSKIFQDVDVFSVKKEENE